MVSRQQCSRIAQIAFGLALVTAVAGQVSAQNSSRKFYPDDPLWQEPPPLPVKHVATLQIDQLYDFLANSFEVPRREGREFRRTPHAALDVNTLGEVPDSPWYTNRHYYRRMTLEELKRGPGDSRPPSSTGAWRVISAKSDGVMPGFVIEDRNKNRYLLKFDPPDDSELASAADVIGSKFFYALGYNTPENYIVHFRREDLEISDGVKWRDVTGKKRPLTGRVLDQLLKPQAKRGDGTYRAMASLWISGDIIGPFKYQGTRSDDPNDTVPHEDRRELRGLRVFASWLNHTDAKSINSLDTLVTKNGVPYLMHYLIDFGSILGSAGTGAKLPWYGHEYVLDKNGPALQMVTFGFYAPPWERTAYPKLTGVGRLDYKSFEPMTWKPDYPNPAFLLMDDADAFWAAKQVAAFRDSDIRALVETGQFSDPRATDWVTKCLIERRNKIAEAWFSKVLPLDKFSVVDGKLTFRNLGQSRGIGKGREFSVRWASCDQNGRMKPLPQATGRQVPVQQNDAQYLVATINSSEDPIRVYFRRNEKGLEVVRIDR